MWDRRVPAFLGLAYGLSWGGFVLLKYGLGIGPPWSTLLLGALFMWGPGLAALIQRRWLHIPWQALGVVRTGIRWKWVGLAALLAMALPVLTLFYNWLFGDVLHLAAFGHTSLDKDTMFSTLEELLVSSGMAPEAAQARIQPLVSLPLTGPLVLLVMLLAGALAGGTINLLFGLGEELGWRGMLLHLTRGWGLGPHVLFTGLVWGLWHAPLILGGHNYPDHPVAGVLFMCLLTTAMALPLVWVRIRSGCIWAAALMHGTINGVAGASVLFTSGGTDLFSGGAGLSAVLGLATISLGLFLFDPQFRRQFTIR